MRKKTFACSIFALALALAAGAPPAEAQFTPYLGQVMVFAGYFCPSGWVVTDGRLLTLSEFQDLFTVIGTVYGGDGVQTFALPNTRGPVTLTPGASFVTCIAVQGLFPQR